MKRAWLLFVFWLLPLGFALQREPSFPGQDPIVEEAIRYYEKERFALSKGQKENWWALWTKLEELEKRATNPESKAIIRWFRAGRMRSYLKSPFPLWVFKRNYCPHLLQSPTEKDRAEMWSLKPEERAPYIIYDPFYGPYLQATGRYQEALQRIKDGTIGELYQELEEYFQKEREKLYSQLEEYNPDLCISVHYFEKTGNVYYTTVQTRHEINQWERQVYNYEVEKRIGHLRDKLDKQEYERLRERTYMQVMHEGDAEFEPPLYLLDVLAGLYAYKGDYVKAIYYAEWSMSKEDKYQVAYIGAPSLDINPESRIREWRASCLKQLKAKGEVDELHPLIYINDKPLNPKKGFTKGGEPYVSVLDFSKAIGVSAEWKRTGKLFKITREDDALLIANIKGRWKVYTEEGKRDINAYFKDGELYLPLKELCKLLNLELKWDDDTFIAHVFKK